MGTPVDEGTLFMMINCNCEVNWDKLTIYVDGSFILQTDTIDWH